VSLDAITTAVTARLFQPSDMPAVYAIEEVCFAPPERFSRNQTRALAEDPDCRTWIAILDGVRAGFAMVGLNGFRDARAAYIWTIEVLPVFRRRGVARELLDRMEESATVAGCVALDLHVALRNTDAQALYEVNGFLRTGTERNFYGPGKAAYRYRKALAKSAPESPEK
jgi:ribosomal protein S18 acetylase RimI-like enzyme